jgi:hypothetical protein
MESDRYETEQEKRNRESAPAFKERNEEVLGPRTGAGAPVSPPEGLADVAGPVTADGPAKRSVVHRPADPEDDPRPEAEQHGEPQV